jgi:hypothetical protein
MFERRRYFPATYLVFLMPIALAFPAGMKLPLMAIYCLLALIINCRAIIPFLLLVLTSLATLSPFLLVVQAAVCSSADQLAWRSVAQCTGENSGRVLLNIGLLSAVVLLVAANEWRGSLVASINRMTLPRTVRIMAIVSGAMIGEFRRAALKVHHAYTARGQATPSFHWRNLLALPGMLGVVWASVLNGAAERLRGQWSAEPFWERYVPSTPEQVQPVSYTDLVVLGAAGVVCAVVLAYRLM